MQYLCQISVLNAKWFVYPNIFFQYLSVKYGHTAYLNAQELLETQQVVAIKKYCAVN